MLAERGVALSDRSVFPWLSKRATERDAVRADEVTLLQLEAMAYGARRVTGTVEPISKRSGRRRRFVALLLDGESLPDLTDHGLRLVSD
jgi:hypothetical protein